jgi:serine/threonine protein kinase
MAAPASSDEFLQLVRKSGVVDEKRLNAYEQQLRASGGAPDEPGKLAGFMVRDGLLTHFQAEQFLLGKWRRFTIGKYKVLERLGSGGMGSVYLCEHKFMRRRVAVKVLPAAKAEDAASLERFYREARAAAALDHPNIVRAYDIDQDENLHFLVMEYVDGASLQEVIKKQGPMSLLYAAHYTRQSAVGLQHAHEAGLVHRDIKPGNVLVDRSGTVKVLDMGLARFFNDEEDILTKKYDESVLGTADYLAPEQALDSHNVDIRADIYSLGATFYFCLTGSPPFSEGTVAQKLIWHQTRQPKPIRTFRQDVPEGLAAVVDRMMQKDKSKRFQTPAQVIEALAPWTAKPIQPPPDSWMPRLSIAARGEGGDAPSSSSASTPAPMANLSTVPVRPNPGASAPGTQRVQVPAAVATATPAPVRTQASPAPIPQPVAAAYPQDSNGRTAPTAAHVEDVAPNWGALVDGQPSSRKQSSIRRAPGGPGAVQKLLAQVRRRPRLFLAIGGGFIGLVLLTGLIFVAARLFSGAGQPPKTPTAKPPTPTKISVAPRPEPGDGRTVREALDKAGDTVVVRRYTHDVFLDFPGLNHHVRDVVIEGETTGRLGS